MLLIIDALGADAVAKGLVRDRLRRRRPPTIECECECECKRKGTDAILAALR